MSTTDVAVATNGDRTASEQANAGGDKEIVVRVKGHEFVIPPPLDWDEDVIEGQALLTKKDSDPWGVVLMARGLLGAERYAEMRALGIGPLRFVKALETVMEATPGESSAS